MKNRIKEFRVIKGMSQEKLAEALKTTKATISRLEKGKMPLTQDWMIRIAPALGRQAHELIDMNYEMHVGTSPGGMADAPYKGKRRKVFEMLDEWEGMSATEQDEFLAIALMHKKDTGKPV